LLDILKIDENSTDLQCFIFQFRGLGALATGLNIVKALRLIKSDKIRHTDFYEFLMILLWKRPGQNLFNYLQSSVQPYLIRWLQLFIY